MTQTASASSSTITARRCPQPSGGSTDRPSNASARSRRSSSGTRTSRRSTCCSPRRTRPMAFSRRLSERRDMPTLRESQDLFRDALLGEPASKLVDLVESDGLDPRARLAVYRHHVFITLTATLESAFPVVCQLVDRRFFAYVADAFIRQHPPANPCLDEYGSAFPGFLGAFEACKGLPYLPDVARLEWAIHLAAQAPEVAPLDPTLLGSVEPAEMARLRFTPRVGVAYLVSAWPVDRIWRVHQGESEPMPDLGTGGAYLEISPSGEGVLLRSLEPAVLTFRSALFARMTLGEAIEEAARRDPDLDFAGLIRAFLDDNIFSSFSLAIEEET